MGEIRNCEIHPLLIALIIQIQNSCLFSVCDKTLTKSDLSRKRFIWLTCPDHHFGGRNQDQGNGHCSQTNSMEHIQLTFLYSLGTSTK